jgi:hypothetical protein
VSALHDIRCPACDFERTNVVIVGGRFPSCERCGTRTTWIPRGFATDVVGSTQTSQVLCDPDNSDLPLTWTSSRERDAKMAKQGCVPAGDRVHGALGIGDGPARGTISSIGKRPREKSRVGGADASWKAT